MKWKPSTLKLEPIFYPVAPNGSFEEFLGRALDEESRVVIAIDAALAWPVGFRELVATSYRANHLPTFHPESGQLKNPSLFRETERFVKAKAGKQPLTASGDKFGNHSSKAQALVAWLARRLETVGQSLFRPPFHPWNLDDARAAQHTLIEAYPGASMNSRTFRAVTWPGRPAVSMAEVGKNDIADAKRCAMIGACYSATLGHLPEKTYPPVAVCDSATLGSDFEMELVEEEGWIFTHTEM